MCYNANKNVPAHSNTNSLGVMTPGITTLILKEQITQKFSQNVPFCWVNVVKLNLYDLRDESPVTLYKNVLLVN